METSYDEQGTEIYAGRGKYSRNARSNITELASDVQHDKSNLIMQTLYDRDR